MNSTEHDYPFIPTAGSIIDMIVKYYNTCNGDLEHFAHETIYLLKKNNYIGE